MRARAAGRAAPAGPERPAGRAPRPAAVPRGLPSPSFPAPASGASAPAAVSPASARTVLPPSVPAAVRAVLQAAFLAALLAAASAPAAAYMRSEQLGGFPGLCEDGQCYDDGTPLSDPPPGSSRRLLQHQLASPSCPTDLVYVTVQFPENTGHPGLDLRLAKAMEAKFAAFKRSALELACNDFDGCQGHCLPVGFEIRSHVHQSSPDHLSVFTVERFIGNFRRNRHYRGTVDYSFANYSLVTGAPLAIKDIFPDPARSVPLFWAKVDAALAAAGNCPSSRLRVAGRAVSPRRLGPSDLILTRAGATVALVSPKAGPCRSQAVDLGVRDLLDAGASPALWGLAAPPGR